MWTILKVFIEFVTVSLLFYVLFFWLQGSGILVPALGSDLHPLHWKAKS